VERGPAGGLVGAQQLLYVEGGAHSALWRAGARDEAAVPPDSRWQQAVLRYRRPRAPSRASGPSAVIERALQVPASVHDVVTLYERAALLTSRSGSRKARHARKGGAVTARSRSRSPSRRRGRSALGRMTVGAHQQPGMLPGLVLPRALGVAARRGPGGKLLSGPEHAAVHAERHLPRPVAPENRARRHACLVCVAQLLADELRGAPGGELSFRTASRRSRPGTRPSRPGALGRVRPAVRERSVRGHGLGLGPPQGLGSVHRDQGRSRRRPEKPADEPHRRGTELVDVTGVGRAVSVWPGAYRFPGRASHQLRPR